MGHLAGTTASLDVQQSFDQMPVAAVTADRRLVSRFVALMTAGFSKRVETSPVLESEA